MSQKDEAVGKVIRLLEQCQASTVARVADELEESLEVGPYGVLMSAEDEPLSLPRRWARPVLHEGCGSGV